MAVTENEIYIGSLVDPILLLKNNKLTKVNSVQKVGISAQELSIDTLEFGLHLSDSESTILRSIKYATPMWWYNSGNFIGKFYFSNATSHPNNLWEVQAVSYIGIIDKQKHFGNVYEDGDFLEVANEILGRGQTYTWYQAVEYLQSNGTAWIDTGVFPRDDIRVVLDCELLDDMPEANAKEYLFGSLETSAVSVYDKSVFILMYERGYNKDEATALLEEMITDYVDEYGVSREIAEETVINGLFESNNLIPKEIGWSYSVYRRTVDELFDLAFIGLRQNVESNRDAALYNLSSRSIIDVSPSEETRPGMPESFHPIIITKINDDSYGQPTSVFKTFSYSNKKLIDVPFNKVSEFIPSITGTYPMYIFGINTDGDRASTIQDEDIIRPKMKVYSCQIYQSGVKIRDFRPCYKMSNNQRGMYDSVTNTFFPSVGTGNFSIGQDVSSDVYNLNGKDHEQQENEFSDLKVNGWLPIDSRRNNLYRLLTAYGIAVVKDDSGNIKFVRLKSDSSAYQIDDSRIYDNSDYRYNNAVNKIEITEHSFQGTDPSRMIEIEPIMLFDTVGQQETDVDMFVQFDNAPIMVSTLSTTGTLAIVTDSSGHPRCGVNYAVVRGSGQLWGKPYDHLTKIVSWSRPLGEGEDEKLLSVTNAYLVNVINSSNLLERMKAYYTATSVLMSRIKLGEEKCGDIVSLKDNQKQLIAGFISEMNITISAENKADCEIIKGYAPSEGKFYTHCDVLSGNGTWELPDDVDEIRVILISGGFAGHSGENGSDGTDGRTSRTFPAPANGGSGGEGGNGGLIRQVTIKNPSATYSYHCGTGASVEEQAPTATTFGSYSSSSGNFVPRGIVNIFTGLVYGAKGIDGKDGGKGGGYDNASYEFKSAEGVTFHGVNYPGGKDGRLIALCGLDGANNLSDIRMIYDCYAQDGIGGGAAVGNTGNNANSTPPFSGNSGWQFVTPEFVEDYNGYTHMGLIDYGSGNIYLVGYGGDGANGADAVPGEDAVNYGCGGHGGHGGGGGGHGGFIWGSSRYPHSMGGVSTIIGGQAGTGGSGSAGGKGADGCILIYY